jgi:hypothetical protein
MRTAHTTSVYLTVWDFLAHNQEHRQDKAIIANIRP